MVEFSFIAFVIFLLSLYIWLLHKRDRKSFYILSIVTTIILAFVSYMFIGNKGLESMFLGYIFTGLYLIFFLFSLVFEILNRPESLSHFLTFKILLFIYFVITLVSIFPYINEKFIPLSFFASFIIYTYFFLVKKRRSFYIMFIISTCIFIPLLLEIIDKLY